MNIGTERFAPVALLIHLFSSAKRLWNNFGGVLNGGLVFGYYEDKFSVIYKTEEIGVPPREIE